MTTDLRESVPTAAHLTGDASHSAGATRRITDHNASCSTAARADASRQNARQCAWCEQPIPGTARRDAVCCSVRCRQARHRFLRTVGTTPAVAPGRTLRLAYADPPYPGNARLYRGHRDYAGEVDHPALIAHLATYDGWALSTSAAALPTVLALCPPGVRVAAWHRGERPTASRWPLNAWEPVIYTQGRPNDPSRRTCATRRVDSLVHGISAMTTLPERVIGAKPAAFCRWVFDLLGAQAGDSLDDLFPGSGAVSRAWAAFTTTPNPSHLAAADASHPAGRDASAEVQPSHPPAHTTPPLHNADTELTRKEA
ncbi:hypothetical protein [Nonomuraea typhae]|uniref:hypothetical protein n=1 Tax=Nonomuraea typhae TaxID=2603600 RepID=UPI0012FC2124|nr:hypothetical protein [Nonomuraea typhae]